MRSGDLLAYLSLNRLLYGVLSCSRCYFVRIQSISQKFNSCVTDGPTDGPTDGRTDTPSYRDARTHLKTNNDIKAFVMTLIERAHVKNRRNKKEKIMFSKNLS